MRSILLSVLTILLFSTVATAQSKLGDVSCVYINTINLDSSIAVYEKLGFPKIASNEFPVPWAQVSDGSLLIMLRKDPSPYIGLTYYAADVEKIVAQLEKDSVVFWKKPNDADALKRYYIKSPDGFDIVLSNNLGGFIQPTGTTLLTMKPADFNTADKYPNKQCGAFGEFAHPVKDINISMAFWKKLGFKTNADMKEPYPHAIISDGLMILGLHQTKNFNYPVVTYFGINTDKKIEKLKEKGLQHFSEVTGKNNVSLLTWEGQHFYIFSLGM